MFHLWYWFKRKTPNSIKPVVLVTGAGSGIGLALAKLLYKQDSYRVVVTARIKTIPQLQQIFQESDRFWIRPLDVTNETERTTLFAQVEKAWAGVNILVNNAGISYRAVVEHMTEEDELKQIATNYLGPMGLIRAALPHMRSLGRGKIINISSVSGMLAMPTMASYSASKYALEGASEALWYEAKPFGIDVSLIQPGFIHSNSFKNVYYTRKSQPVIAADGPYCDYYANMAPFVAKLMKQSWTTPEDVAKLALRVIRTENPPLWIPATLDASLFYYIRRLLPRRLLLPILFMALPRARTWGKAHSKRRF